jgi:peptidoglycan/LPS O-acetylase OafA/YrhL
VGLISTRVLLAGLAATAIAGPIAAVGVATALTIRFVEVPASPAARFGSISYSLYLLHVPVGGKIMNLGGRFAHSTPALAALLALAVGASILAAAVFYRFVELPSQRLSSAIPWRRLSVCSAETHLGAAGREESRPSGLKSAPRWI